MPKSPISAFGVNVLVCNIMYYSQFAMYCSVVFQGQMHLGD